jgi:monomeric sarcosine oxidase
MERYDAIVLGIGGVGSAALYQLARRGIRVLGIDRFAPPHDRGSSHGETRVIRQAYFEHSDYVPLLKESYKLWHELESLSRKQLFHKIGLVEIGLPDGVVVPGVLRAADEHGLDVESLTAVQIESRWPGLRAGGNLVGVFERAAGFLRVEDCVQAHVDAAIASGAAVITNTEVLSWTANEREVTVQATEGEFAANRLVIAVGAWSSPVLRGVDVPLVVRRQSLFWFAADAPQYDVANGMPVYLYELPGGIFYGFPKIDALGVKVAEHTTGRVVENPLSVDRNIYLDEQWQLENFLTTYMPGVSHRVTNHTVCLYTMSPDEHFIVDQHPHHASVVFAAGLSGHGFKFTPVLGRALAEKALDGGTDLPIDFLSLKRFDKKSLPPR